MLAHGETLKCMQIRTTITHTKPGYLLLEVVSAIAISTLILTTVFKIADWNLKVSNEAINASNTQMKQAAFFSLMDRAFLEIPGDAVLQLTETETSSHFISEMILQNAGNIFSWANQPFTPQAIKIRTKLNRNNTIDILLEYYAAPLIEGSNTESTDAIDPNQEPLQTLILLDDISQFEWRTWNGQNVDQEGQPEFLNGDWENSTLPRFLELKVRFELEDDAVIHKFWNPSKVNPERHFDNLRSQQQQSQQQQQQTQQGQEAQGQ